MGQIPRSTERISSLVRKCLKIVLRSFVNLGFVLQPRTSQNFSETEQSKAEL